MSPFKIDLINLGIEKRPPTCHFKPKTLEEYNPFKLAVCTVCGGNARAQVGGSYRCAGISKGSSDDSDNKIEAAQAGKNKARLVQKNALVLPAKPAALASRALLRP